MEICSEGQLRALYDHPKGRARDKQLSALEKHSQNFIENAPFMVISTVDKAGNIDVSPRGGKPGFVKVLNPGELIIADSKGNNRLDSMKNILDTGRIGTLFLIPGIDETLRINGSASITTEHRVPDMAVQEQNPPKTYIILKIEEVFLHCAKALMRSKLWTPDYRVEAGNFPTIGQMLNDQLEIHEKSESREAMQERYQADL